MAIKDAEGVSGEMLVLAIERLVQENKAVKSASDENMYKEPHPNPNPDPDPDPHSPR